MLRDILAGAEEPVVAVTGNGAVGRGAWRAVNADAENAPDRRASFPATAARPAAVRGSAESDAIRCVDVFYFHLVSAAWLPLASNLEKKPPSC